MLRIQMPNGSRLPARFNLTQTIGDVYDFVGHANPETRNRPFVVATTFPNKDHTDHSAVLGKMGEFKKGGTAVVKWA
jgi:UBX domain-containing protein 1